jgi:hypothetical protein
MFGLARALSRAIRTNVEVDALILIFSGIWLAISMVAALTFGLDLSGTFSEGWPKKAHRSLSQKERERHERIRQQAPGGLPALLSSTTFWSASPTAADFPSISCAAAEEIG